MSVSLTRTTVRKVSFDTPLEVRVKPEYRTGEFHVLTIQEQFSERPSGNQYEVMVSGWILKKDGTPSKHWGNRSWGAYRSGYSTMTDVPTEISALLEGPNRLAVARL